MRARTVVAVATVLASACCVARGDGIPFKDGRYDGSSTVLTLSDEQQAEAARSGRIRLTSQQRRQIENDAGMLPQEIGVWSTEDAQGACTCELSDMGIRFAPDKLDVPHAYLGRAAAWAEEQASDPDQRLERLLFWRRAAVAGGVTLIVLAAAWCAIARRRRRGRA